MKNLKKIAVVAMLGVMSFGAYSTYEYAMTTDAEHLMMENVEVLTQKEDDGTVRKNCGPIWESGCYADNYGAKCRTPSDCSK